MNAGLDQEAFEVVTNLARKIESLEKKYDQQFRVVFDAIKRLIAENESRKSKPRREIGFHTAQKRQKQF